MHPAQIKAALAVAGYSQVKLAEELGLAGNTVSAVINGRSRSEQIEKRITEITRLSAAELWPQWHGERPLELNGIERELVLAFRAAAPALQAHVMRILGGSADTEEMRHYVKADRGSIAAGRDVTHSSVHEDVAVYDVNTTKPKPKRRSK